MPLINLLPPIVKDPIPNPNPPANALQAAYNSLLNSWYDVTRQAENTVNSANAQLTSLQNQLDGYIKLVKDLTAAAANSIDRAAYNAAINGLNQQIADLNAEIARLIAQEPAPLINKKNPLPNSIFNIQNVGNDALFWLAVVVMAKKDPKSAERIILKMYDTAAISLRAYCHAGMANKVSAWGAGQLLSLFMERHGFITQEQALNFQLGQTIIAGAGVIQEGAKIFRDLPIISYFVAPKGIEASEFPQSVSVVDSIIPKLAKEVGSALPLMAAGA